MAKLSGGLFADLKKVTEKKAAKADKHQVVPVSDVNLFNAAKELVDIREQLERLKIVEAELMNDLKCAGKKEFVSLYDQTNGNPNTFKIEFQGKGEAASMQFIPMDKYLKVEGEERANELRAKYGNAIVTENDEIKVNVELIARKPKYQKALEKFILTSKDIEEADRGVLFQVSTAYSVTKGTIDNLKNYKAPVGELIEDIGVIFAMKNVKMESVKSSLSVTITNPEKKSAKKVK